MLAVFQHNCEIQIKCEIGFSQSHQMTLHCMMRSLAADSTLDLLTFVCNLSKDLHTILDPDGKKNKKTKAEFILKLLFESSPSLVSSLLLVHFLSSYFLTVCLSLNFRSTQVCSTRSSGPVSRTACLWMRNCCLSS